MTREIDAVVVDAAVVDLVRPLLMVKLDYDTGALRLHSGAGILNWDGADWYGLGDMGKIGGMEENLELSASGLRLTLSGINQDSIARTLGENYQGNPAYIYLALLDTNHQIIGSPVTLFQGRMDNHEMTLGSEASISVNVENALRDWDRPRERRYNNDDQRGRYPDDRGLEYVDQATSKELYWGGLAPGGDGWTARR